MKRIGGTPLPFTDGSERYLVGRSASYQAHKGAGWTAHRSVEDECGPESALHDHVGRAEKTPKQWKHCSWPGPLKVWHRHSLLPVRNILLRQALQECLRHTI